MNRWNGYWAVGFVAFALAACGDTIVRDDDDSGSSSGTGGGDGNFEIFDCAFEYSCEDGTVASLPLETCTTNNVLSVLILEADTNGACEQACEDNNSGLATSCSLQCEPRGASCSCPAGVDECSP